MPTSISGNIKDLGIAATSGVTMRFWLRGCQGNQPRVNGSALIAPTQGAIFYFDLISNSSGAISGTLYSTRDAAGTGNGDIEVGGSFTAVWYGMQAIVNGKAGPEVPIHAKNGVALDISNVTALNSTPVVDAATQLSLVDSVQSISTSQTVGFAGAVNTLIKCTAGAGGFTATLPTAVGVSGKKITLVMIDTGPGMVTVNTTSAQTISGLSSWILSNQWQYVTVESDGANWIVVSNN